MYNSFHVVHKADDSFEVEYVTRSRFRDAVQDAFETLILLPLDHRFYSWKLCTVLFEWADSKETVLHVETISREAAFKLCPEFEEIYGEELDTETEDTVG